jgi:hypothetical protein
MKLVRLIKVWQARTYTVCIHLSIYLYDCRQAGKELPPLEHLMGKTHIYETLLDLKFRVSPEAFFQINTSAAEVLYKSVAELSCPTENTTVIDICCGTGPIGLCLAKVFSSMSAQHNVNSLFVILSIFRWSIDHILKVSSQIFRRYHEQCFCNRFLFCH